MDDDDYLEIVIIKMVTDTYLISSHASSVENDSASRLSHSSLSASETHRLWVI